MRVVSLACFKYQYHGISYRYSRIAQAVYRRVHFDRSATFATAAPMLDVPSAVVPTEKIKRKHAMFLVQ